MAETVERKQYTPEFKREAVRLMTDGGQSRRGGTHAGHQSQPAGQMEAPTGAAPRKPRAATQGFEAFPGQGRSHERNWHGYVARTRRSNGA